MRFLVSEGQKEGTHGSVDVGPKGYSRDNGTGSGKLGWKVKHERQ